MTQQPQLKQQKVQQMKQTLQLSRQKVHQLNLTIPASLVGLSMLLQSFELLSLTLLGVTVSKLVAAKRKTQLYLATITAFILTALWAYPSHAKQCSAGVLNEVTTKFSNAFDTLGAADLGATICSLGDIFTGGIVLLGVGTVGLGGWRQSHGEDLKNAWTPAIVMAFIFVLILMINKFAYTDAEFVSPATTSSGN